MKDINRRMDERIAKQIAVGLHSNSDCYISFSENLSCGGLFLAVDEPLPVGEEVGLRFMLDDSDCFFKTKGEVRWTRDGELSFESESRGMGLCFLDLKPKDQKTIQTYLRVYNS